MTSLSMLLTQYWSETVTFFLVFGRTVGVILGAPFWGGRMVPVVVRVWVSMLLSIATYPLVNVVSFATGITIMALVMGLAGEVLLGLMLGWLGQIFFTGVRLAGQAIEIKSGLGLIQLVDPHEGGHSGVFSALLELMAGIIFFTFNGHHLLIQALSSSFQVFPLGGEKFLPRLFAGLVSSSGEIFAIALRVSAPVLIGLLLSDVVLGILSRAIPQMNVFFVAQPLQFALSLLLLLLSLPALVWFAVRQLPTMIGVPGGVG